MTAPVPALQVAKLVDLMCDDTVDCGTRASARARLRNHLAAGGDLPSGVECRRILHRLVACLDQPSGLSESV